MGAEVDADYDDGTGGPSWPREEEEEAEAGSAEEEEGGAAGCAVLCRDGVVGLMVAGPLRPLRLRPPSPAPRYQPPIPLLAPQGSTALPPTKPPLVLALSRSPTLAPFHRGSAGSGPSPPAFRPLLTNTRTRRVRLCRKPAASHPATQPAIQPAIHPATGPPLRSPSPLLPPLPRIFRDQTNASRCS